MMNDQEKKRLSKKLSYALRHRPDSMSLTVDRQGWASVDDVLAGFSRSNLAISMDQLREVVDTNDKLRFEFNAGRTQIRARQGHSIEVDLGYEQSIPPSVLYHGTPVRNERSILANGLKKGSRHDVHLSPDIETAKKVALRRGPDWVIFEVLASGMAKLTDIEFRKSGNDVWLVEHVPAGYLHVHSRARE